MVCVEHDLLVVDGGDARLATIAQAHLSRRRAESVRGGRPLGGGGAKRTVMGLRDQHLVALLDVWCHATSYFEHG